MPFTGWNDFEAETYFPQLGVQLFVLGPGEPIGMYHWEADQEGFLLLSGEALLLIEGQERALRQWDFVHCPAQVKHMIVGAGDGPCAILGVGSREHMTSPDWGGYAVDEVAHRHGVSVDEETSDASLAYARFPKTEPTRYREGWLPRLGGEMFWLIGRSCRVVLALQHLQPVVLGRPSRRIRSSLRRRGS